MTEHEALLKEWQNRLGLQNWHIELNDNCRPENMAMQNVEGCTTWQETTRCAIIDMLDPAFYPSDAVGRGFDWEKVLVHELLHCKLCLVQDVTDDLQARYMHQMIDDLARALVDAKRSGKDGMETDSH